MDDTVGGPGVFPFLIAAVLVGFLSFAVVSMTSFAKISIVLTILRNAMGMQQSPPNIILYSVALIITVYIMTPTIGGIYTAMERRDFQLANFEDYTYAFQAARDIISNFLLKHTDPRHLTLLHETASKLWSPDTVRQVTESDFIILVPSFSLSEMTAAFRIGFLLYIPFLAVDLAVTCIILAMGVSQVQPMTIATPLKLFLFVSIDGWSKIMNGLILSYI
ncbi:MAG: type III secretion protein R [Alphaproteobacteria bacterium]|jgi:type III secretion protein R